MADDYVRYIDKTREYYLSQGYEKPYRWAHFEDIPFAAAQATFAVPRGIGHDQRYRGGVGKRRQG